MTDAVVQASFTKGEFSPALYGRIDLALYGLGLRTCKNFIVRQYGGVSNRPGFAFVGESKDSSKRSRLIPFAFSTVQQYALEFGHLTMRVIKDGGYVTEAGKAITGATQANPVVLTIAGHGYSTGEDIYLAGLVGMTELNGRTLRVTVLTANTVSLQDMAGNNIDGTGFGAYASGGTAARIYTLALPYQEADLPRVKFTQSADVMTLCCPGYAPRELTRTGHAAWSSNAILKTDGPFQDINVDTGKTVYASAASGAVTLTAAGWTFTADMVGTLFYIEQTPDDITPRWEVGKAVLLNAVRRAGAHYYEALNAATTGTYRPDHLEGTATDGDAGVRWQYLHSGFGVVKIDAIGGGGTTATATVQKRLPDLVVGAGNPTYKWAKDAWGGDQGYPETVAYHEQRIIYAATTGQPQTCWGSNITAYKNFGKSNPALDDEALTFALNARQVNQIRHLLPLSELIALTSGSEWKIQGNDGQALSPGSPPDAKVQGYSGASHVPPLVIGGDALYIQEKGSVVRSLGYSFEKDKYLGNDLTVISSHLFTGRAIEEWAYQQVPFSCVWSVRDDGALLGLAYLPEQQVAGWHRHETAGEFESVCCISEGNEDVIYAKVKRTIDGRTVRYTERMASRNIKDIRDWFFVDSGLTYDGRNTTALTMTLSGGTAWDQTETLTLTASASRFTAADVGKAVFFPDPDPDSKKVYRCAITAYTSATAVSVQPNRQIPASLRGVATTDWQLALKTFTNLHHLEGETVSVLADGNVHPQAVVENGSITLQNNAAVVHVGLPYTSDFETLDIAQMRERAKLIPKVNLLVESSRGIFTGPDADRLFEWKQRATEFYDEPIATYTGLVEVQTAGKWDKNGRIFVRQSDPLPVTILAAIPEVAMGQS
jgi:hypothetical protein